MSQNRPSSKEQAPDPARGYGRERPEDEAGMGRLDNNVATPTDRPDEEANAVKNKQNPTRQINAQDVINERARADDRTMDDDLQSDTDTTPPESPNPREQRYPRTGGKGGTPDAGEPRRKG